MTLVFTTTRSWVSAVIRWFDRSKVSHVAIGIDLAGVPVLLHADAGGVQVSLRLAFERSNRVVAEYRCLTLVDDNLATAVAQIGERYDYAGLVGYAAVLLAWRWLHKKIKNPLASPRAVVCSEFVLSLDPGGRYVPDWRDLDPERTTPQDLIDVCVRTAYFERL